MKKFIAILLSILMIFSLTACGGDAVDTTNPDSGIESTMPNDTTTTNPSEEETGVEDVVFTPVTLVSNDRVIFKVTSEPYRDEFWDAYSIDVYVENPTGDTIYVALVETSVNDFMIDPYLTIEIGANKKTNEVCMFMKDDLDRNNITSSIDKVAFKIAVYDSDWAELWRSDEVFVEFN